MSGIAERARALAGGRSDAVPVAGGDSAHAFSVGDRFVKVLRSPRPGFFAAEARGLARLSAAGAPVPEVFSVHDDGIVLAYHPPGPPDWPALGGVVARLHRVSAPAYGSEAPVFLGRFGFDAGTSRDPTDFLVNHRLRPLLRAARGSLGASRADRVAKWLDGVEVAAEGPCEVHGDLWSGNVLHTATGPLLIDPSAQGAERAYDLAMMQLFGGFPDPFWRAYEAIYPLEAPHRRSLLAHQLVFVLVHVVMFGAGYHDAVDRIVR